jgi:hypothetical protein
MTDGAVVHVLGLHLAQPKGVEGPSMAPVFRVVVLGCALLIALAAPRRTAAEDGAARELMRRVFDQVKISFVATMKLSSPGGLEQILDVRHRQFPKASAIYMEVTEPYHMKDTRFLSWDREGGRDEHYTYVPMVKRSLQVADWTLRQSFLGSTFYMVDIATPDMVDYEYALDGAGDAEGVACTRVLSTPRQLEDEPYSRIAYCIDEGKLLSIRTEYFDPEGALLKVWRPDKIELIDGIWTPTSQTMTNVQADTESRLEIVEIRMHVESPDKIFRKVYLDR